MPSNKDYAFTVEAYGSKWDVYRFEKDGKKGMMAFRQVEAPSPLNRHGKWEIGMFKVGEFTPEQVISELEKGPDGAGAN